MELLTRKQVAEIFKVSIRTLQSWDKLQILTPCCKPNGRPRYNSEDVNKLMNNQTTGNNGTNSND